MGRIVRICTGGGLAARPTPWQIGGGSQSMKSLHSKHNGLRSDSWCLSDQTSVRMSAGNSRWSFLVLSDGTRVRRERTNHSTRVAWQVGPGRAREGTGRRPVPGEPRARGVAPGLCPPPSFRRHRLPPSFVCSPPSFAHFSLHPPASWSQSLPNEIAEVATLWGYERPSGALPPETHEDHTAA